MLEHAIKDGKRMNQDVCEINLLIFHFIDFRSAIGRREDICGKIWSGC